MDETSQHLRGAAIERTLDRHDEETRRALVEDLARRMDATGPDVAAVGGVCLEGLISAFAFERGFVAAVEREPGDDDEDLRIVPLASRARGPSAGGAAWAEVQNTEFAVHRPAVGRAVATGAAVSVDDALSPQGGEAVRAILCYPFALHAGVTCVVYLDRGPGKSDLLESEREAFAAACARLAPVFRAAWLARELDRRLGLESPAPDGADCRGSVAEDEDAELAPESAEVPSHFGIVGRDEKLLKILRTIEKIKDTDLNVCIFGESGTGKEILARAIHESGNRRSKAFVAENCGAIPENLLESELFGHVRGAFTGADEDRKGLFEVASGGTLFLDEIGDMSEGMQRKLLRVLEEGSIRPIGGKHTIRVETRVICASNRDLRALVQKSKFRADLYYRLNVVSIEIPPLRERPDDVPLLIAHFAAKVAEDEGIRKRFSRSAFEALTRYSWPGNVRELSNVVQRVLLTSQGRLVTRKEVSALLQAATAAPRSGINVERDQDELILRIPVRDSFNAIIDECERLILINALQQSNWNKSRVTKALRIPRQSLYNKIAKYQLERSWEPDGSEGADPDPE